MGPPLLAIVPARGGSRGIRRKNMQLIAGAPMLAHTVSAIADSGVAERLIVSSDDEEILAWARVRGVEAHRRVAALAADETTIAEVAAAIGDELDWSGTIGVFQPTSPLRSADSVRRAVDQFRSVGADSLMSVMCERHLFWQRNSESAPPRPLFEARVNRQQSEARIMRETGAIQLIRSEILRGGRQMVGPHHLLFELPDDETLDIDTPADLLVAKRALEAGTVVFRLRANRTVGSGHLFHCLRLAEELAAHRLAFLLLDCDQFAVDAVARLGLAHRVEEDLGRDLAALAGPGRNVVVNDVLDTTIAEVSTERALGFGVVCVEDLGPGAALADWVVNALYGAGDGVRDEAAAWGPRYATLRAEFHELPAKVVRSAPERVVITFGGTDPSHLAPRVARLLDEALPRSVGITVVVGPGARASSFPDRVEVLHHIQSMAEQFTNADLIITSAGRTVFEAAATGTPVVVLAQNAREATHTHLSYRSGVVFLGIGRLATDASIVDTVCRLLDDRELRVELSERLRSSIDLHGAERIAARIDQLVRGLT